jgi:hypothetical protein
MGDHRDGGGSGSIVGRLNGPPQRDGAPQNLEVVARNGLEECDFRLGLVADARREIGLARGHPLEGRRGSGVVLEIEEG